ncbi:MAG: very short patch repair endonuclease [Myxococcota bacterium]|nr:very short patch repair endonuclease [Myxococcota bacterium]
MTDVFSRPKRSWIMSRVRGQNTQPELIVRSSLHRRGHRFRLHVRELPGCPDIVLPRHRSVVFVHGCFWHGHKGCRLAALPTTRRLFWRTKFSGNARRDTLVVRRLRRLGWRVLIVWQCQTHDGERLAGRLSRFLAATSTTRSARRPTR